MKRREPDPKALRRAAEDRLRRLGVGEGAETDVDARRLVHELQVHQIELELQNEELRASRTEAEVLLRKYEELFDFAPVGYALVAGDGRIQEANLAAARLLGVARGQLAGRTFGSFVSERDRPAYESFLATVLTRAEDEGAPAEVRELVLVRDLAGAVHVRVTSAVLDAPAPTALLALEDVTARRLAEDALREEARRKDEFLAALSHELRNPLAPIRNGLYLATRLPPGSDKARDALAVIDRQVTHLTRIVDDLLDVTRIARGKVRLVRERLDLRENVRRTVEDHRPAFEAGGVALLCDVDGDAPCWVDGDASRLAQVIGNLLGNALKFTDRGGHVRVAVRRDQVGRVVVRVRDDGVGVAPEVLDRLFEPFAQAPQTLDRTRGGLGLGLATVKGLVELHGGTVEAWSEGPGRGTELVVRLPPAASPPAAPATAHAAHAAPRRVLVVDDNADGAASLKDVLELSGHTVHVALDGPTGLRLARELRPDVVICDIGLPGLDGYDVARAIRADAALGDVWLIAMSGYAGPDDVQRAHAAGFDRHVAKPPSLEALETLFAEAPVARR